MFGRKIPTNGEVTKVENVTLITQRYNLWGRQSIFRPITNRCSMQRILTYIVQVRVEGVVNPYFFLLKIDRANHVHSMQRPLTYF